MNLSTKEELKQTKFIDILGFINLTNDIACRIPITQLTNSSLNFVSFSKFDALVGIVISDGIFSETASIKDLKFCSSANDRLKLPS